MSKKEFLDKHDSCICYRCGEKMYFDKVRNRKLWLAGVGKEGGYNLCDKCYEELEWWLEEYNL